MTTGAEVDIRMAVVGFCLSAILGHTITNKWRKHMIVRSTAIRKVKESSLSSPDLSYPVLPCSVLS